MPKIDEKKYTLNQQLLAEELRETIQGDVLFDKSSRVIYSMDASQYQQFPVGIICPRDKTDLINTVKIANKYKIPILPRGAGTSLAGQTCNFALIIDTSKYLNKIISIDPVNKQAIVEPGVILDTLRNETEKFCLTFGPDPSTHASCTIGGMIGNNSCGVHSVMAGKTVDNIIELEILTYQGELFRVEATTTFELEELRLQNSSKGLIYAKLQKIRDKYAKLIKSKYPVIPRRVSGYNLDELLEENGFNVARALVGSEGTCIIVTEATLKLIHSPQYRTIVIMGYEDIFKACNHIHQILKFNPIGLEGTDISLIENMRAKGHHPEGLKLYPEGNGWLIAEFGGNTKKDADLQAKEFSQSIKKEKNSPYTAIISDPELTRKAWSVREEAVGFSARLSNGKSTWPGWEDSAVAPEKLSAYLRELVKLFKKYSYDYTLYGHFGQGCVHIRISFDLITEHGIKQYRNFMEEATDLIVKFGGSLSGEHGDGQARSEFLEKMYGSELISAFREFKSIWDPTGKMNPGKLVNPYPIDQDLFLGSEYKQNKIDTFFQFPEDNGSFEQATLRCIGVGKCRRTSGGTMCPSYMVTRDEKHSTRGRARLLYDLIHNQNKQSDWYDHEVKEALDLCLACKGCKSDCPTGVDISTYKSEFLEKYYQKHSRPRQATFFGMIHKWADSSSKISEVSNLFIKLPFVNRMVKSYSGIDLEKQLPTLANQTFKEWFVEKQNKQSINQSDQTNTVILWADTFNNYFTPDVAKAAVNTLEFCGYTVKIPIGKLCCGRPLYDFGMLKQAKKQLQEILDTMKNDILKGTPVIGLEPGCLSVFKDELINLFPKNELAIKLSKQVFTLSQFLESNSRIQLLNLPVKALLHGHCHQKALMGMDSEKNLLRKIGMKLHLPDTGCCGMAGSFGFSAEHSEISKEIGELVLLPEVRNVPEEELVITDGFSCREQIKQHTGRRALHIAEVLQTSINLSNETF